ncbi:hypothetical protein HKX48_000511 [Thoreauomyces humboldtii]|nr:hypothetical protein HKX48_000511 [Thoreauomyces humboldtii]
MTAREILASVFGYVALLLWSFQLLPQAIKFYRTKTIDGLSGPMLALWAIWSPFFSAYAIYSDLAIPLLIQPNLFGFFATVCFVQLNYYATRAKQVAEGKPRTGVGRPVIAVMLLVVLLIGLGGLEAGLYFATEKASHTGTQGFVTFMGIAPTLLILIGFFPLYHEMITTQSVDGISVPFICMDIAGGVFSVLALGLRPPPFDGLNAGSYIAVAALDCGVLVLIWFIRWRAGKHGLHASADADAEVGAAAVQEEGQVDAGQTATRANVKGDARDREVELHAVALGRESKSDDDPSRRDQEGNDGQSRDPGTLPPTAAAAAAV